MISAHVSASGKAILAFSFSVAVGKFLAKRLLRFAHQTTTDPLNIGS
jgi:DNA-binding IclR family transcriptional regulator